MSEPQRLLESSSAASRLLRAGLRDNPEPRAARRAAFTLGLGAASASAATGASALAAGAASSAAAGAGATATTATGASVSLVAVAAKWALVGIVGGTMAAGGATAIERVESTSAPQQRAAEPQSPAHVIESPRAPLASLRATAPAVAPHSIAEIGAASFATTQVPVEAPSKQSHPAPKTRATTAVAVRNPGREPARTATDERGGPKRGVQHDTGALGRDLTHIDATRRALKAGDAKRAQELLDGYERTRQTNFFEREALVLRIEALVHQGQQQRAATLASEYFRRFPDDAHARRIRSLLGIQQSD
jgi:hypothetical protein